MSEGVKIEVFTLGEIILKFALPKTFIDQINNVFDEKELTTVEQLQDWQPLLKEGIAISFISLVNLITISLLLITSLVILCLILIYGLATSLAKLVTILINNGQKN